jgi:hypothetical protein
LELHEAKENEKFYWRIYTHYGRTDDLITKGLNAGRREVRFFDTLQHAEVHPFFHLTFNTFHFNEFQFDNRLFGL